MIYIMLAIFASDIQRFSYAATCTLPSSQYNALQSIYYDSGGETWDVPRFDTNWTFPSNVNAPCVDNWAGITCSCDIAKQQYNIVRLLLPSFNMQGSISTSIGYLPHLLNLDLSNNYLKGDIPESLYSLLKLEGLYLYLNQISGSISPEISQLSQLKKLGLYSNNLSGSFPLAICQLSQLDLLALNSNLLVGSIPSEIGQLSLLQILDLHSNSLRGSIPSQIGQLSLLEKLLLYSDCLTGSIPSEIGQLSSLQFLYLYSNSLTGPIPSEIGQLLLLEEIGLYSNSLTGSIPAEIGQLSSLRFLYLFGNSLTGIIPSEIGQLSLKTMYLSSNSFTGSLSPLLGNLKLLDSLYLFDNYISSSIPSSFGNMSSLQYLFLQSNYLSLTIPSSLNNLSSLVNIFMNDNSLTGEFPSGIGSISSLRQISLSSNLLSGNIFPSIRTKKLTTFNIANNLFTGSITDNIFASTKGLSVAVAPGNCLSGLIPESACNIVDTLTIFDFSNSGGNTLCPDNQHIQSRRPALVHGTFSHLGLSGTIPSCLFASTSLTALRLSGNRLEGTIASNPTNISVNIQNLTIAYNSLTGTIPHWIQRHSFLELDLSNNKLSGTLSADFVVSSDQTTLGLAVNRLSGQLPTSIVDISSNMTSLNVLAGNIFACNNNDLPSQDPSASSYSCGSYELYVAALTWAVFVVTTIAIVGVQFLLYRYKAYAHCVSLHAWWKAASNLKLVKSNSDELQGCIHYFQQIPETFSFLVLTGYISYSILFIGLFLIIITLPTYSGFHSIAAIVSYDYGYYVSMAYLHGIQPLIFIGVMLLLLFVMAIFAVRTIIEYISNFRNGKESITKESSTYQLSSSKLYMLGKVIIFIVLNLINFVVVMCVNMAYVNALVNSSTYSRVELLVIQAGVGFFKVVWNTFYVSWSCEWLTTFFSHRLSLQSLYVMSIVNFIIAPVISTVVYNGSCFYFVFNTADAVISDFVLGIVGFGDCSDVLFCFTSLPININSTSIPSFDYSYACGSALIVAYTPVLFSSNLIYGLFQPIIRLIFAFDNPISRLKLHLFNAESNLSFPYNPAVRIPGRGIVVRLMVHSTILLTFGLASPILIIPIVFAITMDCVVSRLLVGKTLYDNNRRMQENISSKFKNLNGIATVNPLSSPQDISTDLNSNSQGSDANHEEKNINADILTMDHLDMKFSWQSLDFCFHLMIFFVLLFWALLFFDMIADDYGVINGIVCMTCYAIFPMAFLFILDKDNVVTKAMSFIGMKSILEHRLVNTCGMDMTTLGLDKSKSAEYLEHMISGATSTYANESNDNFVVNGDIELKITQQAISKVIVEVSVSYDE